MTVTRNLSLTRVTGALPGHVQLHPDILTRFEGAGGGPDPVLLRGGGLDLEADPLLRDVGELHPRQQLPAATTRREDNLLTGVEPEYVWVG